MRMLGPVPSYTLKTGRPLTPMMQQLYDAIYDSGMTLQEVGKKSGFDPVTMSVWFSRGQSARLDAYQVIASTVGMEIKLQRK